MRLIPAGDLESAEPVLAVRWCLEPWEGRALKEVRAENIHVFFVIKYEGTTLEDRYLVPIDQVMTYLNFRRPGNHSVFAKVIWYSKSDDLKDVCLAKYTHRVYKWNVLNEERTGFEVSNYPGERCERISGYLPSLPSTSQVDVTVPREHFPKEPPAWLKRVVNWRYAYPPADQCEFRRRLLASVPKLLTLAPLMGVWAVIATLLRAFAAAFLLLCGMRNIGFSAIVHPWQADIRDVWRDTQASWFTRDTRGERRSLWLLFACPMLHLVIFMILTALTLIFRVGYWALIVLVGKFALALLFRRSTMIAFVVLAGAIGLLRLAMRMRVSRRMRAWRPERVKAVRELQEQQALKEYDDLYLLLACKPTPSLPQVAALPPKRRTLHLRFLDLKAKVCRPYAAS